MYDARHILLKAEPNAEEIATAKAEMEQIRKDILEGCLIGNPLEKLYDYIKRVEAISNFDSPMTIENANRVIRILKDNSFEIIDEDLFQCEEEGNLYSAIKAIEPTDNYGDYLKQLVGLNSKIDAFFEKVLVMDKDENIKNNRIGLLTLLRSYYDIVADFSKIK